MRYTWKHTPMLAYDITQKENIYAKQYGIGLLDYLLG